MFVHIRISPKEPLGVLPIRVGSPCSKAESGVTAGVLFYIYIYIYILSAPAVSSN